VGRKFFLLRGGIFDLRLDTVHLIKEKGHCRDIS
jgi:hypothetical protein